jgi:signal transduction histidine kinase
VIEKENGLADQYAAALMYYLKGGGETALSQAYETGRKAMALGKGVLDMVAIHHEALARALRESEQNNGPRSVGELITNAGHFFEEAVSSYEIAHRGFREASDVVRHTLQLGIVLSHELRTPITSILASGGMLQEVLAADPDTVEGKLLANIRAGTLTLKARTDELMDTIGFRSGALKLRTEPVDLCPVLKQICQRLEPVVADAELELRLQVIGEIPLIRLDVQRFEQVVANLVQNAIKYGADGQYIDVQAEANESHVSVAVQDYGRGIAPWHRARLFQPYFRADEDSGRVTGMGIGLALCQEIVRNHGGEISVESERGKGSRFKILLPIHGKRPEAGRT